MGTHTARDTDYESTEPIQGTPDDSPLIFITTDPGAETYRAPRFTPALGTIRHHRPPLVLHDVTTSTIRPTGQPSTGSVTKKHKRRIYRTAAMPSAVRRAYLWCIAHAHYSPALARFVSRIVG